MPTFLGSIALLLALHIKRKESPTNLILLAAFVSIIYYYYYFVNQSRGKLLCSDVINIFSETKVRNKLYREFTKEQTIQINLIQNWNCVKLQIAIRHLL